MKNSFRIAREFAQRLSSAGHSVPVQGFRCHEFQLLEARDNAAEAILRVVVALTDRELSTLTLAAPTETTVHRRRNMLVREETE